MPLVGYHLLGFEDGPLSFGPVDLKLLSDPAHRDRVESFFSRTPFRLNFIFWNFQHDRRKGEPLPEGRDPIEFAACQYLLTGLKSRPRKTIIHPFVPNEMFLSDAINVVYTGNATGAPAIPMTPHIMGHRMGHIQPLSMTPGVRLYENLCKFAYTYLNQFYGYAAKESIDLYPWGYEGGPIDAFYATAFYKGLTSTHAGRAHRINGWEWIAEWFAQYLNRGRLYLPSDLPVIDLKEHFRNDARIFPKLKLATCPLYGLPRVLERTRPAVPIFKIRRQIEADFAKILTSWEGDVFIT